MIRVLTKPRKQTGTPESTQTTPKKQQVSSLGTQMGQWIKSIVGCLFHLCEALGSILKTGGGGWEEVLLIINGAIQFFSGILYLP